MGELELEEAVANMERIAAELENYVRVLLDTAIRMAEEKVESLYWNNG